jgi:hypothetical protein
MPAAGWQDTTSEPMHDSVFEDKALFSIPGQRFKSRQELKI